MKYGKPWLKTDDAALIELWSNGKTEGEIGLKLGRNAGAVGARIARLRKHGVDLKRRPHVEYEFTPVTDDLLSRLWADGASGEDIANRLNMSRDAVYRRARNLYLYRRYNNSDSRVCTISDVKKTLCRKYGIKASDIESHQRVFSAPRQVAMALARRLSGASLNQIGKRFGGRDHTSVLYAIRVAETKYRAELDLLEFDIRNAREAAE